MGRQQCFDSPGRGTFTNAILGVNLNSCLSWSLMHRNQVTRVTLICDHASSCSARQSRRTQEHHLAQNRSVGRLGPRLVLGHFWHRRRPLAYDHAWTTPPHQRVVHTVLRSGCVPSQRYALAEAFSPQTFRQHPSHRRIIVRCRRQNRLAYRKPRSLAITLTPEVVGSARSGRSYRVISHLGFKMPHS